MLYWYQYALMKTINKKRSVSRNSMLMIKKNQMMYFSMRWIISLNTEDLLILTVFINHFNSVV